MNNIDYLLLKNNEEKAISEFDEKNLEDFRKKIKDVSVAEKSELGKKLYELISKRTYNEESDLEQAVDLVIEGADIEYDDNEKGNFALLICCRKNYLKTAILLIKAGANINKSNKYLTTPVMDCARYGNKYLLGMLILLGADINARCLDGDTALISAKRHNQKECFDILIKANAYLNSRNIANQTILDISSEIVGDIDFFQKPQIYQEESIIENSKKLVLEAKKKLQQIKDESI